MKSFDLAIISTNRADLGILDSILSSASYQPLKTHLILSGGLLDRNDKLSVTRAKKYGLPISKVAIKLNNSNSLEIAESFEDALSKAINFFKRHKYKAVLITGDRFEMYAFALAAFFLKIPVFHLHAGEETFGAIDNVFRHSITSFASMHFCSTSQYAERVHEIKKDAKDVYVVGAPSLDGIYKLNLLSKVELSDFCGMDIQVPTGLVTFHPQTFSKSNLADIEEFIKGLEVLDLKYIITASNVDEGGDLFNTKLKAFCRKKPKERVFIPSMGKIPYFSAMKYADIMIGNSSSGIIEAVAYNLPVVNVGTRQDGRFKTTNISDVPLDSKKIVEISTRLLRRKKASFKNPYVAHPSSSELIFRRINDYLEESI